MKYKPTAKNIALFALLFQLLPLACGLTATLLNPESKSWALGMIVVISEAAMVFWILGWRRDAEAEVMDEREICVRLKVKSLMLNVSTTVLIGTFFVQSLMFHEMPTWVLVAAVLLSGLVTEVAGNIYFRRIT